MDKLLEAISSSSNNNNHNKNKNDLILTWGGTETVIVYDLKYELECFAGFIVPLKEPSIQQKLEEIFYDKIVSIAVKANVPLILDAATWRASTDYINKLGYDTTTTTTTTTTNDDDDDTTTTIIEKINKVAVDVMIQINNRWKLKGLKYGIISAEIGPRGDGYTIDDDIMAINEAELYHQPQIKALQKAGVEMINACTLTYSNEAIGICINASKYNIPIVISPTLEINGLLPDNQTTLDEFIISIDNFCNCNNYTKPLYYMINCIHPSHVEHIFRDDNDNDDNDNENNQSIKLWRNRIKGIRANASKCSHDELDNATTLDNGNITEFGQILANWNHTKGMVVVGGCCGTDYRHIESIINESKKLNL